MSILVYQVVVVRRTSTHLTTPGDKAASPSHVTKASPLPPPSVPHVSTVHPSHTCNYCRHLTCVSTVLLL